MKYIFKHDPFGTLIYKVEEVIKMIDGTPTKCIAFIPVSPFDYEEIEKALSSLRESR